MSSAVSLPNHTFTGQAESSKRLTSIVHILLRNSLAVRLFGVYAVIESNTVNTDVLKNFISFPYCR